MAIGMLGSPGAHAQSAASDHCLISCRCVSGLGRAIRLLGEASPPVLTLGEMTQKVRSVSWHLVSHVSAKTGLE